MRPTASLRSHRHLLAALLLAPMVAQAEPDGYTLLLGFDGTMVVNPHV